MDGSSSHQSNFPLLLQTAGLIVGWVIVHWLSRARDLEKEARSIVSDAAESQVENINALLLDSRKYHLALVRDQELELQIKMRLQDLAESISALDRLSSASESVKNALGTIKALRRAITGKHFEDEHTGSLGERDVIIETIAAEVLRSKRALLLLRLAPYRQR